EIDGQPRGAASGDYLIPVISDHDAMGLLGELAYWIEEKGHDQAGLHLRNDRGDRSAASVRHIRRRGKTAARSHDQKMIGSLSRGFVDRHQIAVAGMKGEETVGGRELDHGHAVGREPEPDDRALIATHRHVRLARKVIGPGRFDERDRWRSACACLPLRFPCWRLLTGFLRLLLRLVARCFYLLPLRGWRGEDDG